MTTLAAALAVGYFSVLILTPGAIRFAWAVGYLDHPEARKLHTSATPLLGGAVVLLGAIAGTLASRVLGGTPGGVPALLAGALIALILGLWDDRFGMHPPMKLVGQGAAAASLLVACGIPDFGMPAPVTFALLLVALVGLMNAVNFLDNMNGMVGGIAAITLAAFAADSIVRGAHGLAAAQLALAGACVGFLVFNFPKASIFLGDAGSLLLGYSLGASALLAVQAAPPGWSRLGPALMLGYPAFDLIFVVVNRLREGRPVYLGGKDHSNHRLASVIQCPIRTVMILWCSTAALCASGFAVLHLLAPRPTLLLSGLWTVLWILCGLRLSSVPVHRPRPA